MNERRYPRFFLKLAPLLPLLIGSALAEAIARAGWVPAYLFPAPTDIVRSLVVDFAEIASGFRSTAFASIVGLGASFFAGILIAIAFSLSPLLKAAIFPYALFFQTVPIIAIAPVLVIWFGFGLPTTIASSFIVSIFPIIASTLLGLQSVDRDSIDLFRLYRAHRLKVLWSLEIPAAAPYILSGLRIAAGLSVIGAIVGEFIGGGGLGGVVDAARAQTRMDKVFAAVFASAFLGVIFVFSINRLSHAVLGRWHASEQKG